MRDQRRRRRFAVGAGDRDERAIRRMRPALAHEELDIADDIDTGGMRKIDRPVRLRMGQRHAGRQHESAANALQSMPCRSAGPDALRRGLGDAVGIVVPGGDIGAAGDQRPGGGKPGTAEPEERDLLVLEAS